MDRSSSNRLLAVSAFAFFVMSILLPQTLFSQQKPKVRTVTIPISIFSKQELKDKKVEELLPVEQLTVTENGQQKAILSIKSVDDNPLSIAFVIQEDLASTFNLQIVDIKRFIRGLPKGTRVMIAYSRAGSLDVRQRFTDDLEMAANSLRIVSGSPGFAPRSPYDGVISILNRFDGVPQGRRAVLLFSDGVDLSNGVNLASVTQSPDLDTAALRAQRKGVAIYSFYTPTVFTENGNSNLAFAGQGALEKLSDETGGRAFRGVTIGPVNYLPFFSELVMTLNRQFALTYLSTHMKKGYYKVSVKSSNPDIKIEHPQGYYYR